MEFLIPFPQLLAALLAIFSLHRLYHIICSYTQRSSKISPPKVPGAWPIVGNVRQIKNNEALRYSLAAWADKLGPVFVMQKGMKKILVVSSWDAAKECYTTSDLAFASRPNSGVGKFSSYNHAVFAVSPYGPHWRQMKMLTRCELTSPHGLEIVKHQRVSEIEAFTKELYCLCKHQSTTVVICEMIYQLAINIMSKTMNGRRVFDTFRGTTDEGGRLRRVLNNLVDAAALTPLSDIFPFRFLEWLDPKGYIKFMKQIGKEFDSIFQGWVDEHRNRRSVERPRSDQDFIDFALSAIENGSVAPEHATDTSIKATVEALMIAGTSTIPIATIWTISLLLNNEHALKHVQKELDQKVGRDRWVEESDINSLDYLKAVIYETMRLYPPGSLGFPHNAREDCCVKGYHIPKGTMLIINMWKVHRDSSIWTEPDKFMPERFLSKDETYNAEKYYFQCIPFGLGRRACPGMPLAQIVVQLTVARLLQGFNLSRPTDKPVDMSEKHSGLLYKALPLEVAITPRLHSKMYQEM
ncbi:hypothetical protein Ancab_040512 [Ancistrocladus abbreviatus]